MQFEYTDPQSEFERLFGGFFYINAFGRIQPGDAERLDAYLHRVAPPPRTTVYINSEGGDVNAAIAMGRVIRSAWFETGIGTYVLEDPKPGSPIVGRTLQPGKCMSAATLMYLGGRLRHMGKGARFGVHQFSYRQPSAESVAESQMLASSIAQFVSDMGIAADFLGISSSVPSSEIRLLTIEDLKRLRVVTGGVTEVEWTTQARGQMLYVRGERDSIFGHHKVMLCFAREVGFLFWGVIEALGREEELTRFGLVEIVIDGEAERIDISSRCSRHVNGIYVHVLSHISEEEARRIAYSESFGVQVRFSSEAEVFLGISAMDTENGRDALATFFETLRAR